jgi:hypothetical protein
MPRLSISLCHFANFFMSDLDASLKLLTGPARNKWGILVLRRVLMWSDDERLLWKRERDR